MRSSIGFMSFKASISQLSTLDSPDHVQESKGTIHLPELASQTPQLLYGVGHFKGIVVQNVSHFNIPKMAPVILKKFEGLAHDSIQFKLYSHIFEIQYIFTARK